MRGRKRVDRRLASNETCPPGEEEQKETGKRREKENLCEQNELGLGRWMDKKTLRA